MGRGSLLPSPGILFPQSFMQNNVADYIRSLLASERFARQVTHHRVLPAREARYGETRRPWPRAIVGVLRERGIASLYSHQALTADIPAHGVKLVRLDRVE